MAGLYSKKIFRTGTTDSIDITTPGTYHSDAFGIGDSSHFSVQLEWDGSPTANFILEFSNDRDANSSTTWTPVNTATISGAVSAQGPDNSLEHFGNAGSNWARVRATVTTGGGNLSGVVQGKA